jgi:DNA-binding MurR/RpiR family transcriptional regulator
MVNQSLSSAESYTWQIIQAHYDEIPEMSISELAELAHVSLSTINRCVRKKGFAGYAAFRYSIKEKNLPQLSGFSKEILAAVAKNEEELLQTINNISAETIEAAVKLIHEAEEILIFSRGLSTNVADELMKKLQLFRKKISLYDDAKYMAYYARFTCPKSLIIVLSLSGTTPEILTALEIAKSRKCRILALTVTPNTRLTAFADVSLIGYKSPLEVNFFDLDVHSRLPLSVLSRVLIDAYSIYTSRNKE